MSWFFYFCIVAVAFLVLMWWLIVKAKVYGNDDRVSNFTIIAVATLFFVGMVGFFTSLAIQMDVNTRGGKGFKSPVFISNTSDKPVVFIVATSTLMLDRIEEHVLQPGERKYLSAFIGGYKLFEQKTLDSETAAHEYAQHERGSNSIAVRYEQLTKSSK